MASLYQRGIVYLNTIEHFRTFEEGFIRGDNYEATMSILNVLKVDVFIETDEGSKLLGDASIFSNRHFKEDVKGHIYCLYAIHPGVILDGVFVFSEKIRDFGTHSVWINEGRNEEFCQRIFSTLKNAGHNVFGACLIDYYDPMALHFTEIGIMKKRVEFSFQNEFRIFVHSELATPIELEIGSIEDIATMLEINYLMGRQFTLG